MSARNVDLLEAQISSFDSLVQSYVGLGVERAQRRLGTYGLFFAGVSVFFAAIAVIDLVETRESVGRWAVAASLAAIGAVWIAVRAHLNRRT